MEYIYCLIEDNVVVNRALFEGPMPDGWAEPGAIWMHDDVAQIGWLLVNGVLVPPPEVEE